MLQPPNLPEPAIRRPVDPRSIASDLIEKLFLVLAEFPGVATRHDYYLALASAVRARLLHRWVDSARTYLFGRHRTVVYLSAEYLMGPQLGANLLNIGIEEPTRVALAQLGLSLDDLVEHEEEPGLGNGGLGRLASCFIESLATLEIPAIGHGLRYEFGIFDQEIRDGWQVERTDRWLRYGNPWEIRRHEVEHTVGFGGWTERVDDGKGGFRVVWHPERTVCGVPYDTTVPGHATDNTNFFRLWSAVAAEEFDLDAFQVGEYWRAVDDKVRSETLTKVLYPNDASPAGRQLRLEQQAFFVSCALQDCIRLLLEIGNIRELPELYAIQMNDTHPALAVAELMRLFVDVHLIPWEEAWDLTCRTFGYTNHTLLAEALEAWPVALMAQLLPRHLEIIFEINRRFLDQVRTRYPGDDARVQRLSLIDETGGRSVRMVHLASVGSHHINGVAPLHGRLLRDTVLPDLAAMHPERFTAISNGVTPRRFLALANPALSQLIDEVVGGDWLRDLERLRALEPLADDPAFRQRWHEIKLKNKRAFAAWLAAKHGNAIHPEALLDAHCKRFHEYKRQHLNLLHVIALWNRLRAGGPEAAGPPRTFVFAGKAAPAYRMAKLMIRLVHGVAEAIEHDPQAREHLRVVFVPDFNVKVAQRIYPAADLSEQISTAGMEASGTGNMKMMMNGALTIGTLDGSNIEIRQATGPEHFFVFGLTADEIAARRRDGYNPRAALDRDRELAEIIDMISAGAFSRGDRELYAPLVRSLLDSDPFMVLADFRAYAEAQARVAAAWTDRDGWLRSSILNTTRSGPFSSDRAIREYADRIWHVAPVHVVMT